MIRAAASLRMVDSFGTANGCMQILQPLESFLFCPARPLRIAAAAGRPAQLEW
jgi:hypothetical protein